MAESSAIVLSAVVTAAGSTRFQRYRCGKVFTGSGELPATVQETTFSDDR
jgi:hypothetical protein